MVIDLTKTIEEIKKTTTIGEIKRLSVNTEDVFTKEEIDLYFTNSLITKTSEIKVAQEVAELLVRIKKNDEEPKRDDKLLSDLELERYGNEMSGTVVFRVLDAKNLIRNKMISLTNFQQFSEEDKTKREEKIKTLEKEIAEERVKLSQEDEAIIPLEAQLSVLVEEQEAAAKAEKRMGALASILSTNTAVKFDYKGREESLDSLTGAADQFAINDYTGTNLTSPATPTPLLTNVMTPKALIAHATTFLNSISATLPFGNYYKTKLSQNVYGSRIYHCKKSVTGEPGLNVGYGMLKVLRGEASKLETLINNSSASNKDDLKGYVKEIEKCIYWHEEIAGEKGYHFIVSKDTGEG